MAIPNDHFIAPLADIIGIFVVVVTLRRIQKKRRLGVDIGNTGWR
jgi:hypothetical protein